MKFEKLALDLRNELNTKIVESYDKRTRCVNIKMNKQIVSQICDLIESQN